MLLHKYSIVVLYPDVDLCICKSGSQDRKSRTISQEIIIIDDASAEVYGLQRTVECE